MEGIFLLLDVAFLTLLAYGVYRVEKKGGEEADFGLFLYSDVPLKVPPAKMNRGRR